MILMLKRTCIMCYNLQRIGLQITIKMKVMRNNIPLLSPPEINSGQAFKGRIRCVSPLQRGNIIFSHTYYETQSIPAALFPVTPLAAGTLFLNGQSLPSARNRNRSPCLIPLFLKGSCSNQSLFSPAAGSNAGINITLPFSRSTPHYPSS